MKHYLLALADDALKFSLITAILIDTYFRIEWFEMNTPLHASMSWLFEKIGA